MDIHFIFAVLDGLENGWRTFDDIKAVNINEFVWFELDGEVICLYEKNDYEYYSHILMNDGYLTMFCGSVALSMKGHDLLFILRSKWVRDDLSDFEFLPFFDAIQVIRDDLISENFGDKIIQITSSDDADIIALTKGGKVLVKSFDADNFRFVGQNVCI